MAQKPRRPLAASQVGRWAGGPVGWWARRKGVENWEHVLWFFSLI